MTTELSPLAPTAEAPAPAEVRDSRNASIFNRVNVVRDILPLAALLALLIIAGSVDPSVG